MNSALDELSRSASTTDCPFCDGNGVLGAETPFGREGDLCLFCGGSGRIRTPNWYIYQPELLRTSMIGGVEIDVDEDDSFERSGSKGRAILL